VIPDWHSFGFGFGVNAGDADNEWRLHFSVGLFSLYFGLNLFRISVGHWFHHPLNTEHWPAGGRTFIHDQRELWIYLHDGGLWICPWHDPMGDTMQRKRWYHEIYVIRPVDIIFGRRKCERKILEAGECLVPMLEGSYRATYKKELFTWKRPRSLFKKQRIDYWLDIPSGIPHEGKGENSWDCDEDGLFGCGGGTLEEAIANAVRHSLRDRKRYGGSYTHRNLNPVYANEPSTRGT
jgi:hypothetical protein